MKVTAIAFANSVKAGKSANEEMFLSDERGFDIDIVDAVRVRLTERNTGNVTWTSLFNTKWWKACEKSTAKESEDAKEPAPKPAKKVTTKKL